jgi:surface polysaccharide O-acyltransferase-like enzyme
MKKKKLLFKNKKSTKLTFNNNKIDANENNIKKVKVRNAGIDFIRITSMYSIIIQHILGHGRAIKKFSKYKELFLMNIIFSWHISTYALISGYIGYKSNRYSNLLYLWFWTIFYTSSITFYLNRLRPEFKTLKVNYINFFPVIFGTYWYFTEYFGMYLFLPVINKGIAYLNKSELRYVFMSLIFIYIILKDIINPRGDPFRMYNGYSVVWLLICFIIGSYFGKFNHYYHGLKQFIFCFLYIIVFYYSTYFCYIISFYPIQYVNGYYKTKLMIYLKQIFVGRISSIPMILQSISILLFLTQIKYNKYLAKIITFIGPLTFGVYLIHEHKLIRVFIIRNLFAKDSNNLPLNSVIKLILLRALKIFIISSFIDYLRHILFTLLRIRKLCTYIEKIIFK